MLYTTIWALAVGLWCLTWLLLLIGTLTLWSRYAMTQLKRYSWGLVPGVILLCLRPRPEWPDPWGWLAQSPSGWFFWAAVALVVAGMVGPFIPLCHVISHLRRILGEWLRRLSVSDQVAAGTDTVSWLKIGRHDARSLLTGAEAQYIGSHSACMFKVTGLDVEPYHARVVCEAGKGQVLYWVRRKGRDAGFTAVYVNGRSIQEHVLKSGDKIAVGQADEILFGTGPKPQRHKGRR